MNARWYGVWLPLALALAASVAEAAAQVWVVRGAGAHFPTLQQAVDAASAGDVILVRSGVDATVTIRGKGLWVVEDVGADARVTERFVVRDLPVDESVVLSGLDLRGDLSAALTLRSNAGSVRLQGLTLVGSYGFNPYPPPSNLHVDGWPAVYVTDCPDVALVACTLSGGGGGVVYDWWQQTAAGNGGHGVEARGSRLALYACTAKGGFGGSVLDTHAWDGADGGNGVDLLETSAFLAGCVLSGGPGGGGGDSGPFGYGGGCGGDGGDGLFAAGAASAVQEQDGGATGGPGGPAGYPVSWCAPAGAPGLPRRFAAGSTFVALPGVARGFELAPVAREGQVVTFVWSGLVGERCQVRASPLGRFAPGGALVGPELTRGLPFATERGLRRVTAGGQARFPYQVPDLGPGVEARTTLIQGLTLGAGSPGAWLGAAWGLVELDSSF